jgi:hypothetical protein
MAQNLTLLCPPGAEEGAISHGHHEFTPFRLPDGRLAVEVPRHVAGPLMRVGGFVLYTEPVPPPPPSGAMARVDRVEGNTSPVNGYSPDADGAVLVPIEMVGDLLAHGYLPADHVKRERARRKAEIHGRIAAMQREYAAIGG